MHSDNKTAASGQSSKELDYSSNNSRKIYKHSFFIMAGCMIIIDIVICMIANTLFKVMWPIKSHQDFGLGLLSDGLVQCVLFIPCIVFFGVPLLLYYFWLRSRPLIKGGLITIAVAIVCISITACFSALGIVYASYLGGIFGMAVAHAVLKPLVIDE